MLNAVKDYLKIDGSGQDSLLSSFISAAKTYLNNAGVREDDIQDKYAVAEVGPIRITCERMGSVIYSVTVTVAEEASADPSAEFENGVIAVTLGTNEEREPDDEKNTAALVAAEIAKIDGFIVEIIGEETEVIVPTVKPVKFTGGTEYDLYKLAVCIYVSMNFYGDEKGGLERALVSIILQTKNYGGGEVEPT